MNSTLNPIAKSVDGLPLRWQTWPPDRRAREDASQAYGSIALKGMPGATCGAGPGGLSQKHLTVFGLGATGGAAARLLARAGVGYLDLVDPDTYGRASFMTQPSEYQDAGLSKAMVQGRLAQQANPACHVRAANGLAQDLLIRDLRKADGLLVAGDNLTLLLWVGRTAAALGKDLLQVAVHGETGSAIVRGYSLSDPTNACPKCGMSQRELADQASRYGCDVDQAAATNTRPTRTAPPICQAAGAFVANEALKLLSSQSDNALAGEELVCSLMSYATWRTALPRNPSCKLSHVRWEIEDVAAAADQTTFACLGRRVGQPAGRPTTQVRSEIPWISFTFCAACGRQVPVRRFARVGSCLGRCECGHALTTVPQGMCSVVPWDDLQVSWDQSIRSLGVRSGEAIGMLRDDQWVYFLTSEENGRDNHEQR